MAFLLYRSTLLPGVDFGDTASFQAAAGARSISPRQAYPLYFALGGLVTTHAGGEPAFGLNLFSAIAGALACGVLVWVASGLTGSIVAGAVGGLLLASSYTFWSQAIIAEVYALHLLMMGLVLAALLWWERRRSLARLTVVFALYAFSFGNHLMTILLAPAIVVFVVTAPGGVRLLFAPRTLLVATLCALAGASQYLWNASYLWNLPDPPQSLAAGMQAFWFDVTKSDWRETMVFAVHPVALRQRPYMYLFDLRQQIGAPGIALAVLGFVALWRRRRLALLLLTAYLVTGTFAFTYNVGDAHVFFLPSHQVVMLMAAAGVSFLLALATKPSCPRLAGPLVAAVLLAYPAWRAWDTWPVMDRHEDTRPVAWLSDMTRGLDDHTLLLGDINWQLENGFDYYASRLRRNMNVVRATDYVLTLPLLIRDNMAAGRTIFATPLARDLAQAAYGGLFEFVPDPRVVAPPLVRRLSSLAPGTPYVITLLAPYPDLVFDRSELADAVRFLTGGTATLPPGASYEMMAGLVGRTPVITSRSDRPYRAAFALGPLPLDVRMESWLPADTIRRAGFGHVIVARRHVLTLERGVSVVALSPTGAPVLATYASSLFAPLPRFEVHVAPQSVPETVQP
jgi:hypothetical protein